MNQIPASGQKAESEKGAAPIEFSEVKAYTRVVDRLGIAAISGRKPNSAVREAAAHIEGGGPHQHTQPAGKHRVFAILSNSLHMNGRTGEGGAPQDSAIHAAAPLQGLDEHGPHIPSD